MSQEALRLRPSSAVTRYDLAVSLAMIGRHADAIRNRAVQPCGCALTFIKRRRCSMPCSVFGHPTCDSRDSPRCRCPALRDHWLPVRTAVRAWGSPSRSNLHRNEVDLGVKAAGNAARARPPLACRQSVR